MYFIVPVNEGLLDINYEDLIEGIQTTIDTCHIKLREGAEIRETSTEISEADFITARENLFNAQ